MKRHYEELLSSDDELEVLGVKGGQSTVDSALCNPSETLPQPSLSPPTADLLPPPFPVASFPLAQWGSAAPPIVIWGCDVGADESEASRWRQRAVADDRGSTLWVDPDFPPCQKSVDGKPDAADAPAAGSPTPEPPPPSTGEEGGDTIPACRCGTEAAKATVKSNTANKGRPYFHCPRRECKFFAWSGGGRPRRAPLAWRRFPGVPLVTDFGFAAPDLRQGAVGDCWFLSALAVVAERHDLVAKLFADLGSGGGPGGGGWHHVRLFLDGRWASVRVDGLLPVTPDPRRPAQASFGGDGGAGGSALKLAFSRCGSEANRGMQLWAPLLEKAYAKAHGSYQAISGGQIDEV